MATLDDRLVAGRTCGSCNVCCVDLTIDDPALQKAQGIRCHNAQDDHSCAIYENRPDSCRTFYCGWRLLKWVRDPLRPDRSGVLVRLEPVKRGKGSGMAAVFTLLNRSALQAEGLAESIAAAVAADVPVSINVPGPPGYTSGQAPMNQVLRDAVRARSRQGVLDLLRKAYEVGLAGETKPIIMVQPSTLRTGGDSPR